MAQGRQGTHDAIGGDPSVRNGPLPLEGAFPASETPIAGQGQGSPPSQLHRRHLVGYVQQFDRPGRAWARGTCRQALIQAASRTASEGGPGVDPQ